MAIKTRSAKNKGYSFQKQITQIILEKFNSLKPEEVFSAPSSISGEDIILSDNARQTLGNVNFELKRQEKINIWDSLEQCEIESKKHKSNPILIFKRNRSDTFATIKLDFLLDLLYTNMKYEELKDGSKIDVEKLKEIFNSEFLKSIIKE